MILRRCVTCNSESCYCVETWNKDQSLFGWQCPKCVPDRPTAEQRLAAILDELEGKARTDYACGCWEVRDGWFTRVSTCDTHSRRKA